MSLFFRISLILFVTVGLLCSTFILRSSGLRYVNKIILENEASTPSSFLAPDNAAENPRTRLTPLPPNIPRPTPTTTPTPETFGTSTIPNASATGSSPGGWEFGTARDARAYGLTREKCQSAFPGLFNEIERAVEFRRNVGNITPDDVDISWKKAGAVRALISDQQLYILETKLEDQVYDVTRSLAILNLISRAITTSPSPLPNIEFSFSTTDIADPTHSNHSIWGLTRTTDEEEKWVISDFGYWSWPLDLVGGYEQIRREIIESEIPFREKIPKVVWRGAVKTNEHRKELLSVTEEKYWADVEGIGWASAIDVKKQDAQKTISIPEHCGYQFVVHTEGHSYSGRGKYLLNCNSISLIPTPTYIEPHHSLLIPSGPHQNYIPLLPDFSDLESKILDLLKRPEDMERIARNGKETFRDRYLTSAAQNCYWRELIWGWSGVSFVPKPPSGGRGVPFETFAIQVVALQPSCSWAWKLLHRC